MDEIKNNAALEAEQTTALAPAAPAEEPEEETIAPDSQDLTLAYYPDRSMNPLYGSDYTNRVVMSLMYQGLFAVDSKNNTTPILCSQYQVTPDNRTWTIYLEPNATFSDMAKKELELIFAAVNEILTITVDAFAKGDNEAAKRIEPLEETIDDMVMILRDRHTKRLKSGACSVGSGLVFMETLTYLERASDQCSSIAVMMLARNNENILQNHYDYLREIHAGNDAAYSAEKERRREQYIKPLKETN